MQTTSPERTLSAAAPSHAPLRFRPAASLRPDLPLAAEHAHELDADRGFVAVLRGCKPQGGIGRGDEVAERFVACGQDMSLLARWIVERRVLSVEWRSELWLPWFQFDVPSMSLRPEFERVSAELRDVFDNWQLARWFVEPNCWLHDRTPVAAFATDAAEVLQAARTDRYVARG